MSLRSRGRWLALGLLGFAGCLVPGRPYPVSPPVQGRLTAGEAAAAPATLILTVLHRENPQLVEIQTRSPGPDGRFAFEPVELEIAGKEFSKVYRVFLEQRVGDEHRYLWRSEFSRKRLSIPIALDCDLGRPLAHGQPCRVLEPLRHPWLIDLGARTYARLCAECHGPEGRIREAWNPVGAADLRRIAARRGGRFDPMEMGEWIEGRSMPEKHAPRGEMPVWGERLSAEYARYAEGDELIGATLEPLLVYLESLQVP